ncbi:hypothetical protein [Algibacter sp. 2305UL17-15]|uniref:hypothetical protein n=1 Tax=Algibacter sp. 2305UL17-15 TaxID=3231268 RepID=UPI00345B3E57
MLKIFTPKDIQELIEKAIQYEASSEADDYLQNLLPKLYPHILENVHIDLDHRLVILKEKSPFYIVMDIYKTMEMDGHGAMANNEFRIFCELIFGADNEYVLVYPNQSFEYYKNQELQKRIGEMYDSMVDFG